MAKSHPIFKLEFLLAVLWAIPFLVFSNVEESKKSIWLFTSMIPFLGISILSIYVGWLMAVKKADMISPLESFAIRFTEKTRGAEAAQKLILEYSKPGRKILMGGISIFSGLLCLIFGVLGIIVSFWFL
jgi:hypothetical protein